MTTVMTKTRFVLGASALLGACYEGARAQGPGTSEYREQQGAPAPCGTPLAEIDGVWAYSNDWDTGTGESCAGAADNGSLRYQCVEVAQRYMEAMFGMPAVWREVWVAADMCTHHPAGTTVHWVSEGYRPAHGDLAVWTDDGYGHVAVVRTVYEDAIEIVEQNSTYDGVDVLYGDPIGGYFRSWGTAPDCFVAADANGGGEVQPPVGPGVGDSSDGAQCDALGYDGTCIADVSMWSEGGHCRVRDCGGEGKTCGLISDAAGWGCLEGTAGSSAFECNALDYEGTCLSGDVLVWVEKGACKVHDCAADGRRCGWRDPSIGNDCIGDGDGGGADEGGGQATLVVAGHELWAREAEWVAYIAREVVPLLEGSREERLTAAARVTWWSLKEGVLDLDDALSYSNCSGPAGDQHIGPIDVCGADRPWQVGLSGAQVPWPYVDVEDTALALYPGQDLTDVLWATAVSAGHHPSTSSVGAAIVASTGDLRRSWLLRNPAVGFTDQTLVVTSECIDQSLSWCYGTGWDTSARYATDRATALDAMDDLYRILDTLAPGDAP